MFENHWLHRHCSNDIRCFTVHTSKPATRLTLNRVFFEIEWMDIMPAGICKTWITGNRSIILPQQLSQQESSNTLVLFVLAGPSGSVFGMVMAGSSVGPTMVRLWIKNPHQPRMCCASWSLWLLVPGSERAISPDLQHPWHSCWNLACLVQQRYLLLAELFMPGPDAESFKWTVSPRRRRGLSAYELASPRRTS